ncbi:ImmA/IrrE family metallo-endopeptidase [Catellatospora chokoriensis]|uniref:IrrE N-terminal-like domain-containing protein n=1 Tax=Catellatospora chokoriensis TaxID=310353 RepID=A0A8J3K0M0_9ACTN|nr:hypothetical protein [Catellatospora chokoriensis]GIF91874.1 hypothetical protein Cch02nite_53180 [Catellatospora chokoriensis]
MPPSREVFAECSSALEGLAIPDPWDVVALVEWLGQQRGRPIILIPWPTAGGVTGCWVAAAHQDYIVYERTATPLHRSVIVCHEVAHIWLGHRGHSTNALADESALPHDYRDDEEIRAETLAELILEKAALPAPKVPADVLRVMKTLDQGVTVDSLADQRGVSARGRRRWRGPRP